MKQNNKLNKALKDALQGHTEPLQEAQWERLSAALGENKPKRRFLPWFFLLTLVALSSVMIGYKLGQNSGGEEISVQQLPSEQSSVSQSHADMDKTGTDHASAVPQSVSAGQVDPQTDIRQQTTPAKQGSQQSVQSGHTNNRLSLASKDNANAVSSSETHPSANVGELINASSYTVPSDPILADNTSYLRLTPSPLRWMSIDPGDQEKSPEKVHDPYKRKPVNRNDGNGSDPEGPKPRFAIGFASGFSPVKTTVSAVTNDQKMHKDTRNLFDQTSNGQKSMFANINFDYLLFSKLNIGLSSGVQYREIANEVNINYKINEIPWRAGNGDIQFYMHVPDSQNPPVISVKSHMVLRYMNLPLKLTYGLVFLKDNEIQLSGGLNMSMLVGARGNSLSVNEFSIKPVGTMVNNLFDIGYTGGLMYSRRIFDNWWLGAEGQFQRNHLKYNMGLGTLKSQTDIYNFNLNIRYRF